MLRFLLALPLVVATLVPQQAAAQNAAPAAYMQIFYEGPNWLAGRRVLSYSPAFRGKTQELVQESDSMRQLSPGALVTEPTGPSVSTGYATVTTGEGTFTPDRNGKMHLEAPAERQLARQREAVEFNRVLSLLEARADLGKAVLARALNDAAADGWEVVQLTTTSPTGGLVYLLRHR